MSASIPSYSESAKYRQNVRTWLDNPGWDLAISMHLPAALIAHLNQTKVQADDITFGRELNYCFNRLDRKLFKSAHRNHGVRVPRDVTLEFTERVGWHAHVLMASPKHIGPSATSLLLQRLWLKQIRPFISRQFEDRLYWARTFEGGYFLYMTKQIGVSSCVDWENIAR